MINRLPFEFRAPATIGSGSSASGAAAVGEITQRMLQRTAACIGAYPTVTLATAFVAGLAIGRLVKT